jgi:hypothetical protein
MEATRRRKQKSFVFFASFVVHTVRPTIVGADDATTKFTKSTKNRSTDGIAVLASRSNPFRVHGRLAGCHACIAKQGKHAESPLRHAHAAIATWAWHPATV